ncbi:radical SAM protein [Noviherbaspirillum massiliense]|uniref:radical SAM protein n=1 Tax=Noviherbaspirillum massiliense TaxID=1465823 RepID=UPI0002D928D1|nr:radical SAM protein [Noviherbaspirillum massiliense]
MTPTPLPRFVQIEPVGQCNLRCRMCPIQFRTDGGPGKPSAFLRFDDFRTLIDQYPDVEELQLQGLGEPLLHPKFFHMVRYATARGIRVSTNTNMTVMTEQRAEECVRSGLHTLHVSLDGASAEAYEAIRIRARFDRVLRNLRRLVQAKARLQSELPHLRLVAVVMRANLPELPELVQLAHDEGVHTVFVQHLCHDFGEASLPAHYRPMREFIDSETLLHEDLARIEQFFDAARARAAALSVDLRLPRTRPRPEGETPASGRSRCDWPWRGSYVSYDGKAMPCCMVATPDRINFGSMLDEGVEQVWNNPAYTEFRRQLSSDTPPEVCRSCALYSGTF